MTYYINMLKWRDILEILISPIQISIHSKYSNITGDSIWPVQN